LMTEANVDAAAVTPAPAATPAETLPQDGGPIYVDQAVDSRRLARPIMAGFMAVAAAVVIIAANPNALPNLAKLFDRSDPFAPKSLTAAEMQREEIAQLISDTDSDVVIAAAEGDDAIAQNALMPNSGLPVEAARPFQLPRLSAAQSSNAERCLTQAIYYEAATEGDAGKAAVAQVILNRMRHPAYPDSVCAVVYQGSTRPGCQFSFACDGSMARQPMPALWRRAGEIARAALAGYVHKPVGMATHYHANYVLPYWAPKLTKIEQIGAHIFYRWPGNWGRPRAFADTYVGQEAIPAFNSLFKGSGLTPAMAEEGGVTALPAPRDPTDHRTETDVGGRIDTSKGWTPSIPDPTSSSSRFTRLTGEQASSDETNSKSE
jgi:spore germination cell wall hydrolase CwlJ-like protein